jgi:hypothetical protein
MKYFSQQDESVSPDLRRKICGLACVKMIIDYYNPEQEKDINELIEEGNLIGAYDENQNGGLWLHDGLVRLMRNYGISCYPQEFRSVKVNLETKEFEESKHEDALMQKGIEKIMRFVKKDKPIIASFKAGFSENTDSHLVLITGMKTKKDDNSPIFMVHDPISGPDLEITLDHFLKYWKKMVIFVN